MLFKSIILGLLFGVSAYAVAGETSNNYSGIWQDINQTNEFYVIQESANELVLVALPGVEASGDTLSYSYIGNKQDLILTRLSSNESHENIFGVLQLEFKSDDSVLIIPVCDVCGVVIIELTKIF